jgi:CelD/BcsL family acetyltransferase involved in cellulose biosynthesis
MAGSNESSAVTSVLSVSATEIAKAQAFMSQATRPAPLARARCIGREGCSTEWLTSEPELARLRPEWTRLAEAADNIFCTPEWASVWWRHWGRGRRLAIMACRAPSGRLSGLVPLYEFARRPITILRFIGHGAGDVLGPVCVPRDRQEVGRAIRSALKERLGTGDLLLAERMDAQEGWGGALAGRLVRHEPSPMLRIGGMSWEDFLSTRSRNFRDKLRRSERRLRASGGIRIRLANDPDRLQRDLHTLIRLHNARWTASSSNAFAGRRHAFHLEWARIALARGWLRLWLMELGEDPIAAWYGFRFGGAESYYQAGRDPAWGPESVGFVLMCHSIKQAMADGASEFRLLRGGETYKARFASDDDGLETVLVGNPLAVRLVGDAAALAPSLPAGIKRRIYNAVS